MEEKLPEGYITPDRTWAAVPYGNKFMTIHNGQQICVHHTLETAKKFIQKNKKRKK